MKLMCTACQQWLQVGDEFAGQRMKCPLCNNVFSVPALPPDADAPPPLLSPPKPLGSPPTSAGGSTPMFTKDSDVPSGSSSTSSGSEVYKVVDDPKPIPPAAPPQTSVPPLPPPASTTTAAPRTSPTPAPTLSPSGYTVAHGLSINPQIVQWIPVGCLAVIFVLQLFTWVRFAPGGEDIVTQNAWQAATGLVTTDNDLKNIAEVVKGDKEKIEVGASVFSIFYLLFFLPALAIVAAVAALPFINTPLPPQVKQLLPWRWAICAAATAIPLLFLGLQVVSGYAMQSQVDANVTTELKKSMGDYDKLNTEGKKKYDLSYGVAVDAVSQTVWVKAALLLHVVALAAAGLMFWFSQRADNRPLPRLEVKW